MTDQQLKKRILLRLSNGITTVDELKSLIALFERKYKTQGKIIADLLEWQAYIQFQKRLLTSVFSEIGKSYPNGYRKYCIKSEYQNTKLFIGLINKFILIGQEYGDITNPKFYGLPDPGYKISLEALVHIMLRHNESINSFINIDSKKNGYKPSSFNSGDFVEPMLTMLMALNILEQNDWKPATVGKNLICNFRVGGQEYTLIRKGTSKEILSFYLRNDNQNVEYIELERNPDKMEFRKML